MTSKAAAAPASRPLHPCLLSVFDGNYGAEYSTWAHITTKQNELPNLVTAQNNCLRIYRIEEENGKLMVEKSFSELSGSICYIDVIESSSSGPDDSASLLVGFSGHPQIAIVSVRQATPETFTSRPTVLMATSVIDLTQILIDHSMGSTTTLDQDLIASMERQENPNLATVSVILGGGVAVAVLELCRVKSANGGNGGWHASEPYVLPLADLARSIHSDYLLSPNGSISGGNFYQNANAYQPTIAHGFGSIISSCFLPVFLEPTIVLLHSRSSHGRAWPGRLGRPDGSGGTAFSLLATAITVTVAQSRSAILWSREVPADSHTLYKLGKKGCLVVGVNGILEVGNGGKTSKLLAVNGWARSTCPPSLLRDLEPNPWPLPRLSIQLDACRLDFINETVAILSLRRGQLYSLQRLGNIWSLIPIGKTLGGIGQVANVAALPFQRMPKVLQENIAKGSKKSSLGLIFVGSRMGDSLLMGYTVENDVVLMDQSEGEPRKRPRTNISIEEKQAAHVETDDEFEVILRREEDELYDDADQQVVCEDVPKNVIPPSDDEDQASKLNETERKRKRAKLVRISLVRSITPLDSIPALGPIGPGCEGPISAAKNTSSSESSYILSGQPKFSGVIGGTAQVFPSGYGSSGGLALVSVPGRDDRAILGEADCLDGQALFNLPSRGLVLMSLASGGTTTLRVNPLLSAPHGESNEKADVDDAVHLEEVDLIDWCNPADPEMKGTFHDPLYVLMHTALLHAAEVDSERFMVVIKSEENFCYQIVLFNDASDHVEVVSSVELWNDDGTGLLSVSPIHRDVTSDIVIFVCVWISGSVSLVILKGGDKVSKIDIPSSPRESLDPTKVAIGEVTGEEKAQESSKEIHHDDEYQSFYRSDRIVAADVFDAPRYIFSSILGIQEDQGQKPCANGSAVDDEDDLYREGTGEDSKGQAATDLETSDPDNSLETFVALARQSGILQVFDLSQLEKNADTAEPLWQTEGCGHGLCILADKREGKTTARKPRMHKITPVEIRFFSCGPLTARHPTFALALETNFGDVHLYSRQKGFDAAFGREALKLCGRPSKEQSRHHAKLKRKGILQSTSMDDTTSDLKAFRHNRLHRFVGISQRNGLFAATSRPLWILSERAELKVLFHRARHVAPAGGKSRPVTGFCSSVKSGKEGQRNEFFVTLHERIGRIGSQRLTAFSDLSSVFTSHGFLPGGGTFVQKVPFGVTVRSIHFIDDPQVSSSSHPLYAVLISRELEIDQSHLNDDGISAAERKRIQEEKEEAKIKRQVEADLGGFDLEQEWVEEIERENCFELDKSLGGAPPISKAAYSLWIVDVSSNWNVVDSHELEEFEVGMTMQVMRLSEVTEDGGAIRNTGDDPEPDQMFIAIGTGIVDADGEDVCSRGRVLLFQVKAQDESTILPQAPVAELSLVYERVISHGSVTSLSCLTSDGKNRLIIGAGADINVEQWGKNRLTQVGFFRATMQILSIQIFKNFFLLSDAYDSLHFLVWRESDKSLTLLAKDYEPIPVFASGLMSRGASVSFICHDDRQNLQFFQYAPGDAAARGGNKLVCRADFHLGSQVVNFQTHFCRSSLLVDSATPDSTLAALKSQDSLFGRGDDDQRLGVFFGTSDGGACAVIPVSEPVYWRLTALQSVMANALENDCSLNPRAWRLYRRTPRRGGCRSNERKKGVVDGDLVSQFSDLSLPDQEDLASAIGSTVELILDNLVELRCNSMIV